MKRLGKGITRTVYGVGVYAIKVPWGHKHSVLRGVLANRSEWKQRHRPEVLAPLFTIAYLINVYPWVVVVDDEEWWESGPRPLLSLMGFSWEESKASSWGSIVRTQPGRTILREDWVLIDYDRSYQEPRGWLGGIYYWREERPFKKEMKKWKHDRTS